MDESKIARQKFDKPLRMSSAATEDDFAIMPKIRDIVGRGNNAEVNGKKDGSLMRLKHKVRINIADKSGRKQEVLQSERRSIPKRLLTLLFSEFCEVLVLTPGETVEGIEIQEMRGECHE